IVTWTVDTTKPVLTVPTTGLALGCNPTTLPDDASVTAASGATDTCSTPTITATYADSTTGCVTTRDFTVTATDGCNNSCSKHVIYTWTEDTTAPGLTVPANKTGVTHVEGCDTSAITGLTYSESAVTITGAQLSTAGGSASDACGISSITYQDSKTGSCPIVVTRTFTAKDVCLNTTTKTQTIEVDDTTAPSLRSEARRVGEERGDGCE